MKKILFTLLFTLSAFAGTTRISLEGNIKNYTNIPTDELRASIFWQCSKKSWFFSGWSKGCGDGETFSEVTEEGNFEFKRVKTKQGNRHNSMQLRIYHGDRAIKLIDILSYKDEVQERLNLISLYELEVNTVEFSLKSGKDINTWINTTGRDSDLSVEIHFPNTVDGENSRTGGLFNTNFNVLKETFIVAVGDLGKNPVVDKRLTVHNYALADHLEEKMIYDSGVITTTLDSNINEIVESNVIDDSFLLQELSRIPEGKFRISLDYINATRVHGDLIFSCDDGQIKGNFEYAWWDEELERHIYEVAELNGVCGIDMAEITLSTSRLPEAHTIKIDEVSYHIFAHQQHLRYVGVFDAAGNSIVSNKL